MCNIYIYNTYNRDTRTHTQTDKYLKIRCVCCVCVLNNKQSFDVCVTNDRIYVAYDDMNLCFQVCRSNQCFNIQTHIAQLDLNDMHMQSIISDFCSHTIHIHTYNYWQCQTINCDSNVLNWQKKLVVVTQIARLMNPSDQYIFVWDLILNYAFLTIPFGNGEEPEVESCKTAAINDTAINYD